VENGNATITEQEQIVQIEKEEVSDE